MSSARLQRAAARVTFAATIPTSLPSQSALHWNSPLMSPHPRPTNSHRESRASPESIAGWLFDFPGPRPPSLTTTSSPLTPLPIQKSKINKTACSRFGYERTRREVREAHPNQSAANELRKTCMRRPFRPISVPPFTPIHPLTFLCVTRCPLSSLFILPPACSIAGTDPVDVI